MMPSLYAILGHSPLTSASPRMQEAGFAALGLDARYLRLGELSADDALALGRRLNLAGANVTAPFKEDLFQHVEPIGVARTIRAVNTLIFEGDRVLGANTDPDGVIGALRELGAAPFEGRRAAVIGTGGAARAAVFALARQGVEVAVLGRDQDKARALSGAFGFGETSDLTSGAARKIVEGADILIGAVSARDRLIDPAWIDRRAIVLDANYGRSSRLLIDAREKGCAAADGLSWLLHQGASSLALWTGRPAPIEAMRAALFTPEARPRDLATRKPRRGLALAGFSGAGKSALALALASKIGLPAIDLDGEVERRAGRPIAEIFAASGEAAFRAIERSTLREIAPTPSVLAMGGGALIDPLNRPIAREDRLVVLLDIDPIAAIARLDEASRPCLAPSPGMSRAALARRCLAVRREGYLRASDLVLDAGRPLGELANRLARLWATLT